MDPALSAAERPDPVNKLLAVRRALTDACAQADRDPNRVTLVAASKTVPLETIEQTIEAGQQVFGENRVKETKSKWPALRERFPEVELHLIGPLQSNKVREAVKLFDAIHSVDRVSLCQALARECKKQGRRPKIFIQVNTGTEPQKAGVDVAGVDDFIAACRQTYNLDVVGLMCIPPIDEPPGPHFTLLAKIAASNQLESLSMGMSTDFPLAIELGATHVRVGSAIFGRRAGARPPLPLGRRDL